MSTSKNADLASRTFQNRAFQVFWALFLFLVAIPMSWPVRNALLVIWVHGTNAYFQQGLRVLPGKPIRFSDGSYPPVLPDMVTGFGVFFLATFGLSLAMIALLHAFDRQSRAKTPPEA
jgi:hypothetical protein